MNSEVSASLLLLLSTTNCGVYFTCGILNTVSYQNISVVLKSKASQTTIFQGMFARINFTPSRFYVNLRSCILLTRLKVHTAFMHM